MDATKEDEDQGDGGQVGCSGVRPWSRPFRRWHSALPAPAEVSAGARAGEAATCG